MMIDERLEKLAERHEALTHTVELIAAQNADRDKRLGDIIDVIARLSAQVRPLDESAIVTNGMVLRHERMLEEHREWLVSHTMAIREHDERMKQLDGKLDRIADLILRSQGGNGHA
jgi:hypothetical protein